MEESVEKPVQTEIGRDARVGVTRRQVVPPQDFMEDHPVSEAPEPESDQDQSGRSGTEA